MKKILLVFAVITFINCNAQEKKVAQKILKET